MDIYELVLNKLIHLNQSFSNYYFNNLSFKNKINHRKTLSPSCVKWSHVHCFSWFRKTFPTCQNCQNKRGGKYGGAPSKQKHSDVKLLTLSLFLNNCYMLMFQVYIKTGVISLSPPPFLLISLTPLLGSEVYGVSPSVEVWMHKALQHHLFYKFKHMTMIKDSLKP